jgi:hypothetical protein
MQRAEKLIAEIEADAKVPSRLFTWVKALMAAEPDVSWDTAIWRIAGDSPR